jgi:type I restriction enzyme R subunit
MATGTGKTLLSAAIAKLYLRTGNATRVLFLVDRLELETQAQKNFRLYLANDGIETVVYKQKRRDWANAQVVVTTIQSLAAQNRYLTDFAPTDFQLIISDEAHRTISGNNRAIFEYFVGAKLGLTPRQGLPQGRRRPRPRRQPAAFERRLLLDTYRTFGCDDGTPTFPVQPDGRRHPRSALPRQPGRPRRPHRDHDPAALRGWLQGEGRARRGRRGDRAHVRRKRLRTPFLFRGDQPQLRPLFSRPRPCDPLTGEIGKTICFAVSRRHATKLVAALNIEAARRWPAAYGAGSAFAVQVTSDQPARSR